MFIEMHKKEGTILRKLASGNKANFTIFSIIIIIIIILLVVCLKQVLSIDKQIYEIEPRSISI